MSNPKSSAKANSRTCVLVLGMHRSGTSALAGVFSRLGCEMPASPMPASKGNEKGFFESTVIRDLNEDLLASAGSAWDDFAQFHPDWLRSPDAPRFLARAVDILQAEFGDAPLFVLKDPRICRLVPFWTEALDRFGCSVKPVLTIRNPLDVGQSLLVKRGFSEPLSQMVWLRHVLDAERATRGIPRFNTSFEQLMAGWELVAKRTEEELGLAWPKAISSAEFDIGRFLKGELRHHKDSPKRVLTSGLLPQWLRETYQILSGWAERGEDPGDYARLDSVKAEFDIASDAFSRLVRAERDAGAETKEKVRDLEEAREALRSELEAVVSKSREDLLGIEIRLTELRAEQDAERTALEQSLAMERQAREDERSALLAQLTDADVQVQQERAALKQHLAEFDQERELFRTELAANHERAEEEIGKLKDLLQQQRRQRTLMDADLFDLKRVKETLEGQLAEVQSELAASRARRKEMARVIARRDAELQARYEELAALERHMLQSSAWGRTKRFFARINNELSRPFRRKAGLYRAMSAETLRSSPGT